MTLRSPITVRRAVPADLRGVASIEEPCFGDAGDAFTRRQLAYLIGRAQGACYVALEGERIAGYISLLTRRTACNVRIYSVAVDPAFRGRGIGQSLLDAAISYARSTGAARITLEVRPSSRAAVTLYTKNGFVVDGILPRYYHDGEEARRMSLAIG